MNYLVIEMQTNKGVMSTLNYQYDNLNSARQKFYTICASACVSSVDVHTVTIIDEKGSISEVQSFEHGETT